MKTKHLYVCPLIIALMWLSLEVSGYRNTRATEAVLADSLPANNHESSIGPVRNLRFTLFEQGIRPAQMRINAGLVNISIEDKTTNGNGLVIEHVEANQRISVGNVRNMQNQARGRSQVRFTSGTYELQDVVRPDNKAVLIVEP